MVLVVLISFMTVGTAETPPGTADGDSLETHPTSATPRRTPRSSVIRSNLTSAVPTPTKGAQSTTPNADTSLEGVGGYRFRPECDAQGGWASADPVPTLCISDSEATAPKLDNVYEFRHMNCSLEAPSYECRGRRVRSRLVGPITTAPGEWASVVVELPDLIDSGDKIIKFAGDLMGSDGRAVPYPPIHMHHYHVSHRGVAHTFAVHGDYQIDEDGYYSQRVPAGKCLVSDGKPMWLQVQVNDVQLDGAGSAMGGVVGEPDRNESQSNRSRRGPGGASATPVTWYLRIVFELAPPDEQCEMLHKIVSKWPMTTFARHDVYGRYDVGSSDRVYFWPMVMRVPGQIVLPGWIHSHRARYKGMVLVEGAHSMHSLTGVGPACVGSLDPACHDIKAARQRVMENAGRRVVCHDDPSVPNSVVLVSPLGVTGHYDRPGRFLCDPFNFSEGQTFTLFSFSGPAYHPGRTASSTFPQHTMMFFYFRVDPGSKYAGIKATSVMQVKPKTYGVWELADPTAYSDQMPLFLFNGANVGVGIINSSRFNESFALRSPPVSSRWHDGVALSSRVQVWAPLAAFGAVLIGVFVRRLRERAPSVSTPVATVAS